MNISKEFKKKFRNRDFNGCRTMLNQNTTDVLSSFLNTDDIDIAAWIAKNSRDHVLDEVFLSLCREGDFTKTAFIFKIDPEIKIENQHIKHVVFSGNSQFLNWILDICRKRHYAIGYKKIFQNAVISGSIDNVILLLNFDDFPHHSIDMNEFFDLSVYAQNFDLCKWFDKNFNIDYSYKNNLFFRTAVTQGYLDIAEFIYRKDPNINIHAYNEYLFCNVCEKGSVKTLEFLLEKFPDIDVHCNNEKPFRMACFCNNQKVVNFLYEKFPDINVRINDDECFKKAIEFENSELCKWFTEKFPNVYIKE